MVGKRGRLRKLDAEFASSGENLVGNRRRLRSGLLGLLDPAGENLECGAILPITNLNKRKRGKGLGVEMELITRIVGTGDPDLLRLLKRAKSPGQGSRSDLSPLGGDSPPSDPKGQSSERTADRLAREAPGRYEAVKSGELSLNAAAVLAGIRPRRISVRTDNPQSVAQALRRHFTADQLAELIRFLIGGEDP